jgi:integrase
MSLSDLAIRRLKPTDKDQFIADGDGLYLRVSKTGRKTFVQREQAHGKSRWVTLGTYPSLSLMDARTAIHNARSSAQPLNKTFAQAWEAYHQHLVETVRRPDNHAQQITANFLTPFGTTPIRLVTRADISGVLQDMLDRGSPVSAKRALQVVRGMFDFAVSRGWLEENVLSRLSSRHIGPPVQSRDRVLSDDELMRIIRNTALAPRMTLKRKLIYGLLLLTGQRRAEVLGIHTGEVQGAWWIIPEERTKAQREQKVYLSPQARALVKLAFRQFGDRPFRGLDPSSVSASANYTVRHWQMTHFTLHDLRRTMATRLAETGVGLHVIEKLLNHRMEGVLAVYNRAEYLPERREAWRLWGRHVAALRKKEPPEG